MFHGRLRRNYELLRFVASANPSNDDVIQLFRISIIEEEGEGRGRRRRQEEEEVLFDRRTEVVDMDILL
jgi:hypothetical protein